jgi:para-nitrobenzyl esterase
MIENKQPAADTPRKHPTRAGRTRHDRLRSQSSDRRSVDQAERDTRIRDIVLDFVTGEQTRLWPAVADRPTPESVGNPPFEAGAHYQAALDLWDNIDRP